MEKIKPCPFCGGDAKVRLFCPGSYWICCAEEECRVGPGTNDYGTKEEAIKAWNDRK